MSGLRPPVPRGSLKSQLAIEMERVLDEARADVAARVAGGATLLTPGDPQIERNRQALTKAIQPFVDSLDALIDAAFSEATAPEPQTAAAVPAGKPS